ncbi:uncharacterized protein LOC116010755 [Ipomoea triloba]|uniref:uncharacterized protein LOC116010755 n=1 Tax=Ipomoea triloba TaxID=35885 RepID=UPI00125E8D52|nr:uncharacterized protein LOC116010755 [Ipomoea triloba]
MNDILKHSGIVDCKLVSTPVSLVKSADASVVPYADPTQYRSVAGHMHAPTTADWCMLKRVIRYVKGTLHYGLHVTKSLSSELHAFSDSDWTGNPDDRKSTSGFAVYFGSNLVSWSCRKQRTVARLSTEAEYKALMDVTAEVTWLVSLLKEIGLPARSVPRLWCDNLGATYLCAKHVGD